MFRLSAFAVKVDRKDKPQCLCGTQCILSVRQGEVSPIKGNQYFVCKNYISVANEGEKAPLPCGFSVNAVEFREKTLNDEAQPKAVIKEKRKQLLDQWQSRFLCNVI